MNEYIHITFSASVILWILGLISLGFNRSDIAMHFYVIGAIIFIAGFIYPCICSCYVYYIDDYEEIV